MRDINSRDVRILEAGSAPDIADMRTLFIEYQRWLGQDLTFQSFSAELHLSQATTHRRGGACCWHVTLTVLRWLESR